MTQEEMQAAVNALKQPGALNPAIAAFQKKHGDYHLVPTHTKDEDKDEWAKSFYMKSSTVSEQQGTQMKSVWGKAPTEQPKMVPVSGFVPVDGSDYPVIIRSALASGEYTLVPSGTDPAVFKFISAIPAPYAGFTYLAGGKASSGGHSLPVRIHINVVVIKGGAMPKIKTAFPASTNF